MSHIVQFGLLISDPWSAVLLFKGNVFGKWVLLTGLLCKAMLLIRERKTTGWRKAFGAKKVQHMGVNKSQHSMGILIHFALHSGNRNTFSPLRMLKSHLSSFLEKVAHNFLSFSCCNSKETFFVARTRLFTRRVNVPPMGVGGFTFLLMIIINSKSITCRSAE